MKSFNFQYHSDLAYALKKYNAIMPDPHFTLIDGAILCLVKSFYEQGQKFFMSNKELSNLLLSDPGTVQRSIDKLVAAGLLSKEKEYIGSKPRRFLLYQEDKIQEIYNLR